MDGTVIDCRLTEESNDCISGGADASEKLIYSDDPGADDRAFLIYTATQGVYWLV